MPANRNLSALELAILEGALASGENLESLSQKAGVNSKDLQNVFTNVGLSLPTASAAKITDEERAAYIGALTSGSSAGDLPGMYGFSSQDMVSRLQEAQLLIPLLSNEQEAFNYAQSQGFTAEQAAQYFNVSLDYVNTGLAAAGLQLTGKKPTTKTTTTPQIGSNNPSAALLQAPNYRSILGGIPQIPSLRHTFKNAARQKDPNWMGTTDTILTSGRGLTDDANIEVKTLLGS